jgi:hypothetical protein
MPGRGRIRCSLQIEIGDRHAAAGSPEAFGNSEADTLCRVVISATLSSSFITLFSLTDRKKRS